MREIALLKRPYCLNLAALLALIVVLSEYFFCSQGRASCARGDRSNNHRDGYFLELSNCDVPIRQKLRTVVRCPLC